MKEPAGKSAELMGCGRAPCVCADGFRAAYDSACSPFARTPSRKEGRPSESIIIVYNDRKTNRRASAVASGFLFRGVLFPPACVSCVQDDVHVRLHGCGPEAHVAGGHDGRLLGAPPEVSFLFFCVVFCFRFPFFFFFFVFLVSYPCMSSRRGRAQRLGRGKAFFRAGSQAEPFFGSSLCSRG